MRNFHIVALVALATLLFVAACGGARSAPSGDAAVAADGDRAARNPRGCPASVPEHGAVCSVGSATRCRYLQRVCVDYDDIYWSCYCAGGRWDCGHGYHCPGDFPRPDVGVAAVDAGP